MTTATRLLSGLGAAGALAVPLLVPAPTLAASAPPAAAERTVTIRADGVELSGEVRSPRASCRQGVTVLLIKQKGARGGGDDDRIASDTTEDDGSWDTGNTGEEGKFYARVKASPGCQGDTSPTVTARRPN